MHTTLLRNCIFLCLWRHILRKHIYVKTRGLFYFKTNICLLWIEKRFLKNSNKFFHCLWGLRLDENFASIYTAFSTNFYQEFLHWFIGRIKYKCSFCKNEKLTLLAAKFLQYTRLTSERLSWLLMHNFCYFCQSPILLLKILKW